MGLSILAFFTNIIVDNPYTHKFVRHLLNEQVEKYTHLTVDFEAIKLTVLPLGVSLYGIEVATDKDKQNNLVSASQISAYVSLWGMFLGKPRLSSFEANDVKVIWPPPKSFKIFLKQSELLTNSENDPVVWPPDFDVPVELIKINNLDAYVKIDGTQDDLPDDDNFVMALKSLDFELEMNDWNDINSFVKIKTIDASQNDISLLEETALNINFELDETVFTLSKIETDGSRFKSKGSLIGTINREKMDRYDNRYMIDSIDLKTSHTFSADLSILGTYLETANTRGLVQGNLNANFFIPIESDKEYSQEISGNGKAFDGFIDGFRLFNSSTEFNVREDGFYLTNTDFIIDETSFGKASGKILFNDKVDYDFDFAPNKLHLMDLLNVFGVDFQEFDTTITSPDLKIKGSGSPFKMTVNATGLFDDFDTPSAQYDKSTFAKSPSCIFNVRLAIDSDGLDLGTTQGHCFTTQSPITVQRGVTKPSHARDVSEVSLSGPIYFGPKGMVMKIKAPDFQLPLANYFAQIPLSGSGPLLAVIQGPYEDIAILINGKIRDTKIAKLALKELTINSKMNNGALHWNNISFKLNNDSYANLTNGQLQFNDQMTLSTNLEARDLPNSFSQQLSESFYPKLKLQFGLSNLTANLEGSIFYPLAMQGNISGQLSDVKVDDVLYSDNIIFDIDSTKQGWKSNVMQATLGTFVLNNEIEHQRAFPFSFEEANSNNNFWTNIGLHPDDKIISSFSTEALAPAIDSEKTTNQFAKIPYAGEYLTKAGIEGVLSIKGKLRGTTDDLQGAFEAQTASTMILGSKVAPVKFNGFVDNSKIDLIINHGGNSLEGRLSLNLSKPGIPYEWYLNFNRTDLSFIATDLFAKDPRNFLYLTANWNMKGQFQNFWHSNGRLAVKDIRGKYSQELSGQNKSIDLEQDEPIEIDFSKDGWKIMDDKALFLNARNLRMRISLPNCKPPESIGIKATTILDLALLKEFSGEIDSASGKIRVITEITGPTDDIDVSVQVTDLKRNPFIASTWRPVQLGLAMIRPPFRNVELDISYKNQRLEIINFSTNKGAGTINGNGSLNFDKDRIEPSRLNFNLDNATLVYPVAVLKSFETLLSGNISVSGNGIPFKLGGDVNITRARSTKEVDIRNEIFDALRRSNFRTELASEEPLVEFDLNINADKSINIHNRSVKAILSADLQIRGTDIAPQIIGQVEVNRGEFNYKRDFNIVRGIVTFDDPVKPDPSLDILAEATVGSYKVYINTTGRASNPQIEYSTDPPTRENGTPIGKLETLILLSKGDLPEEGKSFADSQNAALSEGISIVMSQMDSPFEKILDKTGQSVIRTIYFDTFSDGGAPEPRINLPLDLGEDFDIIFKFHESGNEISSEYSLDENVKLSGKVEDRDLEDTKSTSATGNASVDLKFRFSFD